MADNKIYGNPTVTPINVKKLVGDADLSNYLSKDNTEAYTPSADYNPATKKYVDDAIKNIDIPDVDLSDYYTKTEVDTAIAEKDFVVTLDVVEENISLSKTHDEIVTAFTEGKSVYLKVLVSDNIFSVPLVGVDAINTAIFAGFSQPGYYIKLSLSSNNNIVYVNEDRLIDQGTLSEEYYNKTETDTAIQNAIGDVLGGAS